MTSIGFKVINLSTYIPIAGINSTDSAISIAYAGTYIDEEKESIIAIAVTAIDRTSIEKGKRTLGKKSLTTIDPKRLCMYRTHIAKGIATTAPIALTIAPPKYSVDHVQASLSSIGAKKKIRKLVITRVANIERVKRVPILRNLASTL